MSFNKNNKVFNRKKCAFIYLVFPVVGCKTSGCSLVDFPHLPRSQCPSDHFSTKRPLRKGCQRIWLFPALIKGLSAACQALGDRAGDRKQHHKGIPSIMFFQDINICHTPLTELYYIPRVRHLSILELLCKPMYVYVCV